MSADTAKYVDISLTIGGDAGQGVESSGSGFSLALARAGYQVFSMADYQSRIRGGHNFYQIRAANFSIHSHSDPPHLLIALTEESVEVHASRLAEQGGIIYDTSLKGALRLAQEAGALPFPTPLGEIAERHGSKVMINTASVATAAAIIGLDLDPVIGVIEQRFGEKSKEIARRNAKVAEDAYEYGWTHFAGQFRYKLPPPPIPPPHMLISGNEAFAIGAATGGCRFISAYPMTPATTILEWMTYRAKELGIVTKHAEDEIAAVCMAIGASFAGARAMTATSGGGFDLMVEALGLAGIVELPLVVTEVQRGGPSTGLPTRTEQSDLLSVIHASHGEFPRIVLAPGTAEEYFECGWRAFNLADKYQTPVIVMADQFLAGSPRTVPAAAFAYDSVRIDRAKTIAPHALHRNGSPNGNGALSRNEHGLVHADNGVIHEPGHYLRHAFTDDGISPRGLPGDPDTVHAVTSDEHDPEGHITENKEIRINMHAKRMNKLELARADMRPPTLIGEDGADLTLICWGSTVGPATESLPLIAEHGLRVNLLHFCDLWPFPTDRVVSILASVRRSVAVEQNYTAQFCRLLRMETGYKVDHAVLKWDGRPFSPQEIAASVLEEVGIHA